MLSRASSLKIKRTARGAKTRSARGRGVLFSEKGTGGVNDVSTVLLLVWQASYHRRVVIFAEDFTSRVLCGFPPGVPLERASYMRTGPIAKQLRSLIVRQCAIV